MVATLKPGPVVRSMFLHDVPAVMAIEERVYPFGWSAGIFSDCIRVGYHCWVLEGRKDGIIGYGVMSVAVNEAHILNITIAPEHQNRGHGRRMLTHLLTLAQEHHAEAAFLEVRPTNRSAIHLYESEGFNQVGVRRDYYPGEHGREDAMIMARQLD